MPRNTWFPAYCSKVAILWRQYNDACLYMMHKLGVPSFYNIITVTQEVPIESHPIHIQQMGDQVCTHKPFCLDAWCEEHTTAWIVIQDSIKNATQDILTLRSDGLVCVHDGLLAYSWFSHHTENQQIRAAILSIRWHCYCHTEVNVPKATTNKLSRLKPLEVPQWCNTDVAVDRSNRHIVCPSDMSAPDVFY